MRDRSTQSTSLTLTISLLSICIIGLLHEIILYSTNTFQVHPEWMNSKYLLDLPPWGFEGDDSRVLLHRNQLWIHEWHGANEYLLKRIFKPGRIRFRFSIGANSYLYVIFHKTADGFSGFRLSRSSQFPAIYFQADREGKFLLKQTLQIRNIYKGWNKAEVVFTDDSVSISCDRSDRQSFRQSNPSNQLVGFRSGKNPAALDDVQVYNSSGKMVINEAFRNHRTLWFLLFPGCCVSILLAVILIFYNPDKLALFKVLLCEFSILSILLLYYAFDYYYWSGKYHFGVNTEWKRSDLPLEPFEKMRLLIFDHLGKWNPRKDASVKRMIEFLSLKPQYSYRFQGVTVIGRTSAENHLDRIGDNRNEIVNYLDEFQLNSVTKILFLGSSQTFGHGATYPTDRIAYRFWENLSANHHNVIVVNASKSGTNSAELLKRCHSHLFLFKPSIVLINLSNNDGLNQFRQNLEAFMEWTKAIGSKVIFVQEANNYEVDQSRLLAKHAIMADIANRAGAPLFAFNKYMSRADIYDSGILWWDEVHMTSFGQRIAAEYLAHELLKTGFLENYIHPQKN